MDDSKTLRNLIGFTGLALLVTGYLLLQGSSVAACAIAGGQLGLTSAFALDYVARHRRPDMRQREALRILRRHFRSW